MEQFLSALPATLIQGLIYALISLGVYITYSILDFPDLGVDGTFPLGAAVTAVLLTRGVDPWLTLVAAVAVGADGLMIETHNNPAKAKSDGAQSLTPDQFDALMKVIKPELEFFGKKLN